MSVRLTTEEFVAGAQAVHGTEKYKYDKVAYHNVKTKITITCNKHGDFMQRPDLHLSGKGCLKCSQTDTEGFISKSKKVHGSVRYHYDKTVYVNTETPVIITCPIHGDFKQVPHKHLSGRQCLKCAQESMKMSSDKFFDAAGKRHNGKYDYQNADYVGYETKITIICPVHGEFEQTPHNHLHSGGCMSCGRESARAARRSSTKRFIDSAQKVYGDRYDYSKVDYVNNTTKVVIICKKHGEFLQRPANHLSKKGCIQCALEQFRQVRRTTDEFIESLKAIHGDKYVYDKVDYQKGHHKITIGCPKHGYFEQRASKHLFGEGCKKCAIDASTLAKTGSTETFIQAANTKHNGTYTYDKVKYVRNSIKVIITCPSHGDFEQVPSSHLGGAGCPKCGISKNAERARKSTEAFVAEAMRVHDDKWSYDKTDYKDSRLKVIITCPTHGDFTQTPDSHLSGHGCPKCNSSTGEGLVRKILDNKGLSYEEQVRIASCRKKRPLPFDFMVNADTPMMIEFHGIQHYELNSFRGTGKDTQEQMEANLARVQLHDAIKAKWCADNNIPLLVIPYWDKHRIPELLEEFLGSASLVGAV